MRSVRGNFLRVILNLGILIAAALLPACSSSPSSPTQYQNFAGNYNGTYSVTSCSETAAYSGFCSGAGFTSGTILPISLSLTQNQGTVTGTITLGAVTGTFNGTVQSSGNMTGSATLGNLSAEGITVLTNVSGWNTTISGNNLSGTFTVAFTVSGIAGGATVNATIVQLVRS